MNPASAYGLHTAPTAPHPLPQLRRAPVPGPSTAAGTDLPSNDRPRTPPTPVITPPQRLQIEVEWHAASLSYVHRMFDPETGRQVNQFPAAQVLAMVDDLMRQIEKG